MGGHSTLVGGIEVDEAVNFIVVWRGRYVVSMFSMVKIGLFAEAEACMG